jgi:ABC-type branched-subunit amino acid transport system ATPase component
VPVLEIDELVGGYGGTMILDRASLNVEDGEIVAIVGPNGSGKSTLLKAIIGLVKPEAGRVVLDGTDVTGHSPEMMVRLGVGYLPQEANVFPALSVRENLELMLPRRTKRAVTLERLAETIDLFPSLKPRLGMRARLLSGGERQMLALARVLVIHPKLLMLDEPTAALAPIAIDAILAKISAINSVSGVPMLLVEQRARKALECAHRAYILEGGRVVVSGSASDLAAHPEIGRLYLGASLRSSPADPQRHEATPTPPRPRTRS